ncbi:MAG: ABC transporter permease [Fimbriiglobus sp.]|jgi:ribose transport system permease protein|nr:ABC transporter permease [Fimbriiglobus sp.]
MNEKVKFGAALGGGFAVAAGVWFATHTYHDPKDHLPAPWSEATLTAWFIAAAVAVGVLAYSFELTRRNLQRLAGVTLLLGGLLAALGYSGHQKVQENEPLIDTLTSRIERLQREGNTAEATDLREQVVKLQQNPAFGRTNVFEKLNRHGEYGILCIGAGLLILAGGIDLSVGSLVGLAAVLFGVLVEKGVHPFLALPAVLAVGGTVGLIHGLMVTQVRVQAFLVTLCGMFVYRGLARTISPGSPGMVRAQEVWPDFSAPLMQLRQWLTGIGADERLGFPGVFVLMLVLAAVAAVFLHRSAFGRYWYAIGYNEQAARYAGVTVWRHKVAVFAVCSLLAALAGVIRFLGAGSVTPSSEGQSFELYAITAAVLGGVSLKGGEGTAVGMVLGALVLPVVNTLMNFAKIPSEWEPWLIGLILLFGTVADELIRRSRGGR